MVPGRRYYFINGIIFLSLIFSDFIQSQNLNFGHISVEDGLSNSYVNCLLQDKTGFIWFGTDDGLNRFDGYEIKIYRNNPEDKFSISENTIWALFEDRTGKIWIGTKTGGLNKYDPQTDKFVHWNLDSTSSEEINITCVFEDRKGTIWIGTYKNGLYRLNPSKNKFEHWQNTSDNPNLLSNNFITSIIEYHGSEIWISTFKGLDTFNEGNSENPFTLIFSDSKNPVWYLSESVFFKNTILLGALNGLFKFDPVKKELKQINLPENHQSQFASSVSSIAEEVYQGQNILWVGTFGGLVRLNLTEGYSERFLHSKNEKSGLMSNEIHDIIMDRSGVVWIASENGANNFSHKRSKFNYITPAISYLNKLPGLFNTNVRAISKVDNHSLWFGTDKGLFGIIGKTGNVKIIQNSELNSLNVWSLFGQNSERLWIGTYGQGLREFNVKTNELKTWKVDNPKFNTASFNYVKTVLEDNVGSIWIGFWGGGISRLNPLTGKVEHWRNETDDPSSLSYNDVWVINQDKKGRMWIGTNGGGLDLYQGNKRNNFYNWKTTNDKIPKLNSDNIFSICESRNSTNSENKTILWIGTVNGLNKFVIKNDSGSFDGASLNVEIKYYTVDNGLPDNAVESILEDEKGNLWIGTSSGISFFDVASEKSTTYTAADGLNGSSFNSNAAIRTNEGTMLFGCTAGLNYFVPGRINKSTYSPPVVINDFKILNKPNGEKQSPNFHAGIYNSRTFQFSYNQNDFSCQFAALDYNAPEAIQYAYMLEGFDEDWIYSGIRRFVTYTNLDPGEYVFRVKSTNSDGVWNEDSTNLAIIISPPFWMTWWAYTIYGILFIGSLYLIRDTEIKRRNKKEEERLRREREAAQLREAKLKAITIEQEKELEKQKIRNRIAQDLHDEIGSNLSSISLMSELIQKDGKINTEAFEKIQRIQIVAKGSSQAMRDIVWLTNPSSDTLKDLVSKMNEVANDMLGGLKWYFNFPTNISDVVLVPEIKRNLFFIYKESLNNILKHAKARNVNIALNAIDEEITLTIKDDGDGFDTSTSYYGNGLKNLHSRAREINGDLNIESSPNKGTTINLSVNITQLRD